jgi:DNA-binding NtrC family response regulator
MTTLHLLVLAADAERRRTLAAPLRAAGLSVVEADDAPTAARAVGVPGLDAIALDLRLPLLDLGALAAVIAPAEPARPDSLDAAERRHIARTLEHTGGNRRQAALILGISRSTLLHKIRKYDLE